MKLDELNKHIDDLKEKSGNTIKAPPRDEKNYQIEIVDNQNTKKFRQKLDTVNNKLGTLKFNIDKLNEVTKDITKKQRSLETLMGPESKRKTDVFSETKGVTINLNEINDIFQQETDKTIINPMFSTVNLGMFIAIIASIFLWVKLDNYEKNY
jgi:hypothetical protein